MGMSAMAKRPVILVSPSDNGSEELLDRLYLLLTSFGYDVWMSHRGTTPVRSDQTATENRLQAVAECELILGIITPSYDSNAHQELKRAIELNKPRLLLVHDHVVFARRLLRELSFDTPEKRQKLGLIERATSLGDLRVIDLYEDAIGNEESLEAPGSWVQQFRSDEDALLFASAQFYRFQEVERFIAENLMDPAKLRTEIARRKTGWA
jgi:hypothetical protein